MWIDRKHWDPEGKVVKVKWVRINTGMQEHPDVRCRLVAHELGYGERLDELFAGTPSLMVVRMLLRKVAMNRRKLEVKCAFLYGKMRRKVYIELPDQDPEAKGRNKMGRLVKAMYGTSDAPQLWSEKVRREMVALGSQASVLHPSVFSKPDTDVHVVVHVDDFMCVGPWKELDSVYISLKNIYDLKSTFVRRGGCRRLSIRMGRSGYRNRVLGGSPTQSILTI